MTVHVDDTLEAFQRKLSKGGFAYLDNEKATEMRRADYVVKVQLLHESMKEDPARRGERDAMQIDLDLAYTMLDTPLKHDEKEGQYERACLDYTRR